MILLFCFINIEYLYTPYIYEDSVANLSVNYNNQGYREPVFICLFVQIFCFTIWPYNHGPKIAVICYALTVLIEIQRKIL